MSAGDAGDHVVAQVVESELVVRAIRDVGRSCGYLAALGRRHGPSRIQPHVHAQEVIHAASSDSTGHGGPGSRSPSRRARPCRTAHAGSRASVATRRLALAGLHFRDLPVVQGHAADAAARRSAAAPSCARWPRARPRRLRQDGVQILAAGDPFLESRRQRAQLVVRFLLHAAFESVDALHGGLVALELLALAQRGGASKGNLPCICRLSLVMVTAATLAYPASSQRKSIPQTALVRTGRRAGAGRRPADGKARHESRQPCANACRVL